MVSTKSSAKSPALSVLKAITRFVATLSEDDVAALASGRATLSVRRLGDPAREGADGLASRKDEGIDYVRLQESLRTVDSISAGLAKLADAQLTRMELERFARALDLPVMRQDSVGRLEDKILEALVGSRLNSRAVRGR